MNTPTNAAMRPSYREVMDSLAQMLREATQEMSGLPRSLGYDFTHTRKMHTALLKYDEYIRETEQRETLDSHRPAESVSAEPVAWMVTRDNDPSFPRIYTTEAAADAMCKFCNVAPTVRKAPLYLHPQPSTFGAVSDEWSPTIDDMPEGICVAKRIHVERSRHMDNWFVGFGKDESCQIEGTANHWYWLAYALLGLVDEKDSPYSEDKPLPFSPAYIRAALESFAKRIAAPKGDEAVAVDFYSRNPSAALVDFTNRVAPPAQAVSVPERRGIYVASRVHHADMWKRQRMFGVAINSTWIDEAGEGETGDFAELWARIESEIAKSTGLVLYAEQRDFPLKGALVEVGMALAHGVPVFAVLPHVELAGRTMRPVGSWLLDARVTRTDDLGHAIDLAAARASGERAEAKGGGNG